MEIKSAYIQINTLDNTGMRRNKFRIYSTMRLAKALYINFRNDLEENNNLIILKKKDINNLITICDLVLNNTKLAEFLLPASYYGQSYIDNVFYLRDRLKEALNYTNYEHRIILSFKTL